MLQYVPFENLSAVNINSELRMFSDSSHFSNEEYDFLSIISFAKVSFERLLSKILGLCFPSWYGIGRDSSACGLSAGAIMLRNVFKQKYYKEVKTIDNLYKELGNDEEGCFWVSIGFGEYVDHAFVIIKYNNDDKIHYQIVQSYIFKYSLKDNLINNIKYFTEFRILKDEILDPLLLFYKKRINNNNWIDFSSTWYKLSNVILPIEYLGNCNKRYDLRMVRSTNYKSIFDNNWTTNFSIINSCLFLFLIVKFKLK